MRTRIPSASNTARRRSAVKAAARPARTWVTAWTCRSVPDAANRCRCSTAAANSSRCCSTMPRAVAGSNPSWRAP